MSRSREGAWIEMFALLAAHPLKIVAPVRERGLKLHLATYCHSATQVAPVRERGLKYAQSCHTAENNVAPVRERGLKLHIIIISLQYVIGRSREGAWIEILYTGI